MKSIKRLFTATSKRVFVVIPLGLLAVEALLQGGRPEWQPLGLLVMAWGFLQFRLSGRYRTRIGGGGPGLKNPPERLVTSGIFALTRNPMYLGLLIYLAGLAVTLYSWIGALVVIAHVPWFHTRVRRDEARLLELFGEDYALYTQRVKRWLPYLV